MMGNQGKMKLLMKRIYLDVCCLNRPFDDQDQDRIRFESEAVRFILKHIRKGDFIWIGSTVVDLELNRTPDQDRRSEMQMFTKSMVEKVTADLKETRRAEELELLGFGAMDALHLACAEKAKAEVLLTTDDKFLKKGIAHSGKLNVRIANPAIWLQEVVEW